MASREIRTENRPEVGPDATEYVAASKSDKGEVSITIDKDNK